jgi:hypothetical protein
MNVAIFSAVRAKQARCPICNKNVQVFCDLGAPSDRELFDYGPHTCVKASGLAARLRRLVLGT